MKTAKQMISRYNRSTGNFADNLREMGRDDIVDQYGLSDVEAQKVIDHIAQQERGAERVTIVTATRAKSVFDYFCEKLGDEPDDETLRDLPVQSGCGNDCAEAIDVAAKLIAICDKAKRCNRAPILHMVNETCRIFWHG